MAELPQEHEQKQAAADESIYVDHVDRNCSTECTEEELEQALHAPFVCSCGSCTSSMEEEGKRRQEELRKSIEREDTRKVDEEVAEDVASAAGDRTTSGRGSGTSAFPSRTTNEKKKKKTDIAGSGNAEHL